MENASPLHIKMEYGEAISAKKDILQTEIELLKIIKKMKTYSSMRSKELALKLKLYQQLKALAPKIRKLNNSFPKIKDNMHEEQPDGKKKKIKAIYSDSIDTELRDIQDRLNSLNSIHATGK